MKESPSEKCNLVLADSLDNASAMTSKQNWHTPQLHEMDYTTTASGAPTTEGDGIFNS